MLVVLLAAWCLGPLQHVFWSAQPYQPSPAGSAALAQFAQTMPGWPAVSAPAASSNAAAAVGVVARGAAPASVPKSLPTSAPVVAISAPSPDNNLLDLCGIGWRRVADRVAADPTDPASLHADLPADWATQALTTAWPSLLQALAASPDVRQQAAAVLLDPAADRADTPRRLASLARVSGDPAVLQWAVQACSAAGVQPSCPGLSARHWTRAEPGNLAAWLQLSAQEPLARDEALHGMAQAHQLDLGWLRLAAVVDSAVPADWPAALRVDLAVMLMGLDLARGHGLGHWSVLTKACDTTAVQNANRRQTCEAIATTLVCQDNHLLAFKLGLGMGRRLGWPAQRLQADDQLQALMQAHPQQLAAVQQPYSCAAVARSRSYLADVNRLGEIGWLRAQARAAAR